MCFYRGVGVPRIESGCMLGRKKTNENETKYNKGNNIRRLVKQTKGLKIVQTQFQV